MTQIYKKTSFSLMIIFISFAFSACSAFSGRSFIDQMDREDERFFRPGEHFPVVAGDSGQRYRSHDEIIARTPQTERQKNRSIYERSAEDELRLRLNGLSEDEYQQYQIHSPYLSNIGEKIYYLELSQHERNDYVLLKGYNPSTIAVSRNNMRATANQQQMKQNNSRAPASMSGRQPASTGRPSQNMGQSLGLSLNEIRNPDSRPLAVGMSKNQVLNTWGEPLAVDYAGNPQYQNVRWRYRIAGQIREVYFESGRVDGWSYE